MRADDVSTLPDSQRYFIVRHFLEDGRTAKDTRDEVNRLVVENPAWRWRKITRETVYPVVRAEMKKTLRQLVPLDERLADEIARVYQLQRDQLRVVDVRGREARHAIAETAADTIFELIREVAHAKPGRAVHLGFAGGDLVSTVARSLARLLAHEPKLPELALHSLTAGFDPGRPHTDPNTFFAYFEDVPTEKSYHCIYSAPFVNVKGYREVLNSEGVRSSYLARTEIDIAVTGMGSAEDPHSQLQRFHKVASRRPDPHWIGEVGWVPYGESGPAARSSGIRAVALFELYEIVELARTRGKHVVLVAGVCGECGRPKGAALRPLVVEPSLRCWTHLVLELGSAQELASRSAQPMRPARRARGSPRAAGAVRLTQTV